MPAARFCASPHRPLRRIAASLARIKPMTIRMERTMAIADRPGGKRITWRDIASGWFVALTVFGVVALMSG
ncbi:MAG: hypothetical protein Kow0032_04130 [Methyloligellaceae bacterium]